MNSITIHGLDLNLSKQIKDKAKIEGLSLNKTIKSLLEKALGIKPAEQNRYKNDFEEFAGVWKKSDLVEFSNNIKELEKIDEDDWK